MVWSRLLHVQDMMKCSFLVYTFPMLSYLCVSHQGFFTKDLICSTHTANSVKFRVRILPERNRCAMTYKILSSHRLLIMMNGQFWNHWNDAINRQRECQCNLCHDKHEPCLDVIKWSKTCAYVLIIEKNEIKTTKSPANYCIIENSLHSLVN